MDEARNFIDLTLDGKHSDAESAFKTMLAQRVNQVLDDRKRDIAFNLYKRQD